MANNIGTFSSAAELANALHSGKFSSAADEFAKAPHLDAQPAAAADAVEALAASPKPRYPYPAGRSLIRKLADVMAAVDRIAKRGHNRNQNYDYALESDITAALRHELANRAVMIVPDTLGLTWREVTTKAGGTQQICCAKVRFTVHDGDSGETFEFSMPGEGQDAGDKCVPKAITSAVKYACLKLFLIPTGDDPEKDHNPESEATHQAIPRPPASTTEESGSAVLVRRVSTKQGVTTTGKPWTLFVVDFSDGRTGSTFNSEIGAYARECVESETRVVPVLGPGKKPGTVTLLELTLAPNYGPAPAPPPDDDSIAF